MSIHSAIQNLRRRTREGAELGPVEVTETTTPPSESAESPTDRHEHAKAAEAEAGSGRKAKRRSAKAVPIETPQQLAKKTKKAERDAEGPARRQKLREFFRRTGPAVAICSAVFLIAVLVFEMLAPIVGERSMRLFLAPAIFAVSTLIIGIILTKHFAAAPASHMTEDADAVIIRASYDTLGSPRAVFGPDGKMIYANKAFVTLLRRYRGDGISGLQAALGGNRTGLEEFARVCDLASQGIPRSGGTGDARYRRQSGLAPDQRRATGRA